MSHECLRRVLANLPLEPSSVGWTSLVGREAFKAGYSQCRAIVAELAAQEEEPAVINLHPRKWTHDGQAQS